MCECHFNFAPGKGEASFYSIWSIHLLKINNSKHNIVFPSFMKSRWWTHLQICCIMSISPISLPVVIGISLFILMIQWTLVLKYLYLLYFSSHWFRLVPYFVVVYKSSDLRLLKFVFKQCKKLKHLFLYVCNSSIFWQRD